MSSPSYVRFFEEFGIEDIPSVGERTPHSGRCTKSSPIRACACPRLCHYG